MYHCNPVTPANAGVQNLIQGLDSGFRRNDYKLIFFGLIKFGILNFGHCYLFVI